MAIVRTALFMLFCAFATLLQDLDDLRLCKS